MTFGQVLPLLFLLAAAVAAREEAAPPAARAVLEAAEAPPAALAQGSEEKDRVYSLAEVEAPLPPTAKDGDPLEEFLRLEPEGTSELVVSLHQQKEQTRADVLSVWLHGPDGFRLLLREKLLQARGHFYDAFTAELAGRKVLHVITQEEENEGWRNDQLWEFADGKLARIRVEPPATGCGLWLPKLGDEETLGARFELGTGGLAFALGEGSEGEAPAWEGWLGLDHDGQGPFWTLSSCAEGSPAAAGPARAQVRER